MAPVGETRETWPRARFRGQSATTLEAARQFNESEIREANPQLLLADAVAAMRADRPDSASVRRSRRAPSPANAPGVGGSAGPRKVGHPGDGRLVAGG